MTEVPGRADGSSIDEAVFRTVLGHFASGVVVVTGHGPGGPAGFTCQSFFSLSLEPPLVAFAAGAASSSWPRIEATAACTVNVLRDDQEAVARAFSRPGIDRFAGVGWSRGATGAVRLEGALAWIDCEIESVADAGDHRIVIARAVELTSGQGQPLLFYRGGYGTFRP